jgi:hypothetical protein
MGRQPVKTYPTDMQPKEILLFRNTEQTVNVSVYFQKGTFWLTQKSMAELFGVNVSAVNKHLKNIFETGELEQEATVSILEIVRQEGNRSISRNMEFYRLEAFFAVWHFRKKGN